MNSQEIVELRAQVAQLTSTVEELTEQLGAMDFALQHCVKIIENVNNQYQSFTDAMVIKTIRSLNSGQSNSIN